MKIFKRLIITVFIAFGAIALSACEEGVAESAGEKVDEAMSDAGNAIEDACESAKENLNTEDQDC